jgi:hypothetical protein
MFRKHLMTVVVSHSVTATQVAKIRPVISSKSCLQCSKPDLCIPLQAAQRLAEVQHVRKRLQHHASALHMRQSMQVQVAKSTLQAFQQAFHGQYVEMAHDTIGCVLQHDAANSSNSSCWRHGLFACPLAFEQSIALFWGMSAGWL